MRVSTGRQASSSSVATRTCPTLPSGRSKRCQKLSVGETASVRSSWSTRIRAESPSNPRQAASPLCAVVVTSCQPLTARQLAWGYSMSSSKGRECTTGDLVSGREPVRGPVVVRAEVAIGARASANRTPRRSEKPARRMRTARGGLA